jgi:O-antigen/teichoic acid export membrane protein
MDFGLSASLTREMARLATEPGKCHEQRNLLRSLEVIYWVAAAIVGTFLLLLSPLLAHHWINAQGLPFATINSAVRLMGLVFIFQFPSALYHGGLMGLEKQVLVNFINGGMGTFGSAGAAAVLWWISPTIHAFFVWQLIVMILKVLLLRSSLWRQLSSDTSPPRFSIESLQSVWRFAAGMTGITVLSVLLHHLDKIILLKMLPLEEFSYYSIAQTGAGALLMIVTPIQSAVFPRFSSLHARNMEDAVKRLYHKSSQLISVFVFPLMIVMILYPYELLYLWVKDTDIAQHAQLLLSLGSVSVALNCIRQVQHTLQISYGWTALTIKVNSGLAVLMIPLQIILISRWGASGAAIGLVTLKVIQVTLFTLLMHRRLLIKERNSWCLYDVVGPLAAVALVALPIRTMSNANVTGVGSQGALISVTLIGSFLAAAITATRIRSIGYQYLNRIRRLLI